MKGGVVTIKDIARELNISPSTVSRALKNHKDISTRTKKLVNDLAKQLDYQPNTIALSLRKSQTNTIGVIIPEIVHFFFSTIINGIEEVAYKNGYNILLCQSNETFEKEVADSRALINSRVDGMLISCSRETNNYDHLEDIYRRDIPLVFFDRFYDGIPANRVLVDDYEGAKSAVQHLVDQGYKRIAHLAGPSGLHISSDRLRGYKDVLKKSKLAFDENLVKYHNRKLEYVDDGYIKTKELLDMADPPDALFAHQDLHAIGAMKAVKEKGLSIPEDFGIVGFSNWQISSYTDPPLSTVSQFGYKMGMEAANMVISQIRHKNSSSNEPYKLQSSIIKTELIVRGSSKK